MKITCLNPKCGKEFEPKFIDGIVDSNERDARTGEIIYEEERFCCCPYCNWLIFQEDIDELELRDVFIEKAKEEYPEIFEDQEDFQDEDNEENE